MRASKGVFMVCLALLGVAQAGWAQDFIIWRVKSTISSSQPPAYRGQSSPFPYLAPEVPVARIEEVAAPEDMERQQQVNVVMARLEDLRRENRAIIPDTRMIRATARLEGPLGTKILINNQWIGLGEMLRVSERMSPAAQELLAQLRVLDSNSAEQQQDVLLQSMSQESQARLAVKEISRTFVILQSAQRGSQSVFVPLAIRD